MSPAKNTFYLLWIIICQLPITNRQACSSQILYSLNTEFQYLYLQLAEKGLSNRNLSLQLQPSSILITTTWVIITADHPHHQNHQDHQDHQDDHVNCYHRCNSLGEPRSASHPAEAGGGRTPEGNFLQNVCLKISS